MIKRGTQNIIKLYRGAREIIKAHRGTSLVYSAASACLTFSSTSTFSLWVYNQQKNWDGTLEYSTNGTTWTEWDGASSLTPVLSGGSYKLYLRGEGNTYITGDSTPDKRFVINGSDVDCSGNIESLLDHKTVERGEHPTMAASAFRGLFYLCPLISCPVLGAVTLSDYCYANMFQSTNIAELPLLPATQLVFGCYYYMFNGCSGIKVSETEVGEYNTAWRIPTSGTGSSTIYGTTNMLAGTGGTFTGTPDINTTYYYAKEIIPAYLTFSSPSSFTIANVAHARNTWDGTLETSVDGGETWTTFNNGDSVQSGVENTILMRGTGNTRITNQDTTFTMTGSNISCSGNIESLLDYATVENGEHPTMANNCFRCLFENCTALTDITGFTLPATTLSNACYAEMFHGCTGINTLPNLPATSLPAMCYYSMFSGCTGIKLSTSQTGEYQNAFRIPPSGTGTDVGSACYSMFSNTGGTFTGTPSINTTYYTSNAVISVS